MPNIELGSDPSVRLTRALLIYGQGDEVCITSHEVKGGVIQPGSPLDVAELGKLWEGTTTKLGASGWSWGFPRMLCENVEWRVWWSPAQMRDVFVGPDGVKPRAIHSWIPPLVWAAHRTRHTCYLFTYKGDSAPNRETRMYRPQFGPRDMNHVHEDCGICNGTMKLGGCSPEHWEQAFWDSRFKTAGHLGPRPYEIEKVFHFEGSLASALTRCRSAD